MSGVLVDLFTDARVSAPPVRAVNADQVLPEPHRQHFVLVPADETASIEHVGCPLVEVGEGDSGDAGWDCVVDWLTADRSVVFFRHDDPDFEHLGGGDLATFRLLPGRWELTVSVHSWNSLEYGPQQDFDVAVDPAGVVEAL